MLELLKKIGDLAERREFKAYAVGGYVRDMLMGQPTHDLDIVVEGDALNLAALFGQALGLKKKPAVYRRFGTAMVYGPGGVIEFATARRESYSKNSRKPVVKKATLAEDLGRRDFTINTMAMYLDHDRFGQIIDPFNGRADLEAGLIRTPLDAVCTFDDDPLRMLRAVRFSSTFNFKLEKKTKEAIKSLGHRLNQIVSRERIKDELLKMLKIETPSGAIRLLDKVELLKEILPEIKVMQGMRQDGKYHHKDLYGHTLLVLDGMASLVPDVCLRLTALLHDVGKPETRRLYPEKGYTFYGHDLIGAKFTRGILRRLRFSSADTERITNLIKHHMRLNLLEENVTDRALRRLVRELGPILDDLFLLARADRTGYRPCSTSDLDRLSRRIESLGREEIEALKPPLNGHEVMRLLGIKPGPKVGRVLESLLEAVIDQKIEPTPEASKKFVLENFAA